MFEPEKVEIPEKVKFYKKSKGLYVYMVGEKKYIKDKKYVVEKRSLIGLKIDDKYMHPNQNYYKLFNLKREVPVEQEPREFSDTLSVGATITLQTIAEKIGVTKCIKEAFKSDTKCDSDFVSKMIVDLACYSILTGSTAYQHFPTYAFKSPVLTKKVYSDSYVCEFLRNDINEYKIQAFFDSWVKANNNNGTILISYDSTNINCVSDGITLVANGHAKDDESKPIVNISYVIDQKEGTPLFYELYNGAINDVTEVKKMLEKANNYGLKNAIFVADRGYFSKSNLQKILKNFHAFVMMVSLKNNFVKSKIDEFRSTIVDSNNYILPDKVFGTFVETKLYKDDLDGEEKYVYIYFNKAKYSQDEEELMSVLVLEKNNLMKKINNGEAIVFDSDFKEKYPQFDVEYDEKNQVISNLKISNEYLISRLKYSGFFVLVSNIKRSPEEMLSTYRKRDLIEKEFRQMKSQIGFNALNVQSDASLRSKVFIIFIASILRSYIMRKTTEKRNEDSKNFTVEACLKTLSRIEATRNPSTNEYNVLYELTKHQKEILNCLGLTQKLVNKTYNY